MMPITITLFDLNAPLPMWAGEPIEQIFKTLGGTMQEAGVVVEPEQESGIILYYIKSGVNGTSEQESIWYFNLEEETSHAIAINFNDAGWQKTEEGIQEGTSKLISNPDGWDIQKLLLTNNGVDEDTKVDV